MTPPNESVDWSGYAVLTALGAIAVAWIKRVDPRMAWAWWNEPSLRPIHSRLDKVCRVVDHLPGSDEAHAAVLAEDEKLRERWKA